VGYLVEALLAAAIAGGAWRIARRDPARNILGLVAFLAGLAVGFWENRAEIAQLWSARQIFRPKAPRAAMARLQNDWRRAVERAKGWASA